MEHININDIDLNKVKVYIDRNDRNLVEEFGHGIFYLKYEEKQLIFSTIHDYIDICSKLDHINKSISKAFFNIAYDYVDRFLLGIKLLGDPETVIKYLIDQDTVNELQHSKQSITNKLDKLQFVYDKRKLANYSLYDIDPVQIKFDLLVRILDLVFYHSMLTSEPKVDTLNETLYYHLIVNKLEDLRKLFSDAKEKEKNVKEIADTLGLSIQTNFYSESESIYVMSNNKEYADYNSYYTHIDLINPANMISAASYFDNLSEVEINKAIDEVIKSSNGKGLDNAHMKDCPTFVKGYKLAVERFVRLAINARTN